jgi:hypothetical protein
MQMTSDDRQPWERAPGESAPAHHALQHYLDLGPSRSVDKAFRAHLSVCLHRQPGGGRAAGRWQRWSREHAWVDRATAHDADLARQHREAYAAEQRRAAARHAQLARGALQVLSLPVRCLLDALRPATLDQLTAEARTSPAGAVALLGLCVRVAQVLPSLVAIERLSLGITDGPLTDSEQVPGHPVGERIAADPEATALAIALLDRVSRLHPLPETIQ